MAAYCRVYDHIICGLIAYRLGSALDLMLINQKGTNPSSTLHQLKGKHTFRTKPFNHQLSSLSHPTNCRRSFSTVYQNSKLLP